MPEVAHLWHMNNTSSDSCCLFMADVLLLPGRECDLEVAHGQPVLSLNELCDGTERDALVSSGQ